MINKWEQYLDSAKWCKSISNNKELLKKEIKKAVHNIPDGYKDSRILMLGCGNGYELEVLRERGFTDFVGITYTSREKECGYEQIKGRIVLGDMHELPYKDNEFDFVYSKEVLEHSFAPYIVLCELNRVMKDGARFLHYIAEGIQKQQDIYHFSCFPPYVWVDLLHLAGFETEEILTSKDRTNNFIVQSAYYGKKILNKDLKAKVESYHLTTIMRNIKKGKLDLLCD